MEVSVTQFARQVLVSALAALALATAARAKPAGLVAQALPTIDKVDADWLPAAAQGATVEDFAFGSGCKNIRDTAVGEKYQAPGGAWATRTSAPPQRDSRCP